jgi:hypothetical protein
METTERHVQRLKQFKQQQGIAKLKLIRQVEEDEKSTPARTKRPRDGNLTHFGFNIPKEIPASLEMGSHERRFLSLEQVTELDANGVVVIPNVFNATECADMRDAFLDLMASYRSNTDPAKPCEFLQSDRTTWKKANLPGNTRGMQDWPYVIIFSFFPSYIT